MKSFEIPIRLDSIQERMQARDHNDAMLTPEYILEPFIFSLEMNTTAVIKKEKKSS